MVLRALVPLVVAVSLISCGAPAPISNPPRAMDLDVAWANVQSWPGLDSDDQDRIRDGHLYAHTRLLVPADDGHGVVFIAHSGWVVVIASLAPDLCVRDVKVMMAKCGYSVSWEGGLVVTLHKHPGTDMFWDAPYRVDSAGGRLALIEVDATSNEPAMR